MKFLTIGSAERELSDHLAPMSKQPLLTCLLVLAVAVLAIACGTTAPPTGSPTPVTTHDLHAWPELEEQLPDAISGRTLRKVSLAAHPERQDAKTLAVLNRLGRSVADLQLANAELEGTDLMIGAMRVVGIQGDQIIDAFRAVDATDPESVASYSEVNLGGKVVVARTVEGKSTYLYGADDIMFIVSGERELLDAALEQLPS